MKTFDMIVIGAGIAGIKAAKTAAGHGADVAVVEKGELGGTCPLRGCMPKKFLAISAEKVNWATAPGPAGIATTLDELNWSDVIEAEQSIVSQLGDHYGGMLTDDDQIRVFRDSAQFQDNRVLQVGNEKIEGRHIIVATGLSPLRPPIDGIDHAQTSDEFFEDSSLPDSAAIIGGGYIGLEFASILHEFGVEVIVFEMLDFILNQHDRDVSNHLLDELQTRGIEVRLNTEVESIQNHGEGYNVQYRSGARNEEYVTDRVIVAAGRVPNTDNLGLSNTGVSTNEEGLIEVDETYRTDAEGVYAVGDVIGDPQLTPAAIQEGITAAENALNGENRTLDFSAIPSAVFSHPPVGTAGMTEREARASFSGIKIGKNTFKPFGAAVKEQDEEIFIKTIFDEETDQLVGIHVVGAQAPEVVQGFALALEEGCTQERMVSFPGIHPTLGEEVISAVP